MNSTETMQDVTAAEGRESWSKHTYEALIETAVEFNAMITAADLAAMVQERSGLRARGAGRGWLNVALTDVAQRCHGEGRPALTSLVISAASGQVGAAYDTVLELAGLPKFEDDMDREMHAAEARLACYRHYGARVPAKTRPQLAPKVAARYEAKRKAAPARRGEICTTCFTEMPLNGGCTRCDTA